MLDLLPIQDRRLSDKGIRLFLCFTDTHPVRGNKWFKLKYNLEEAKLLGCKRLLSFGGAWSNHIYALADAAQQYGFEAVGIIRGEEVLPLNPSLQFAVDAGMRLHYVSRSQYRDKEDAAFLQELQAAFGPCYILPEGGSNHLAVKGCREIIDEIPMSFDVICTASGTAGTAAGLVSGTNREVWAFPVLKGGGFLEQDMLRLIRQYAELDLGVDFEQFIADKRWRFHTAYHFGGYAKATPALMGFIDDFYQKHGILLDPIYVGKMLYGLFDLIENSPEAEGRCIVALMSRGWERGV